MAFLHKMGGAQSAIVPPLIWWLKSVWLRAATWTATRPLSPALSSRQCPCSLATEQGTGLSW